MRVIIYGVSLLFLIVLRNGYALNTYGPTLENEHLYRIAANLAFNRPVTTQQMMLALLQANPSAFNHHNINGLKSGYRLWVPSLSLARELSPAQAEQIVTQHNLAWSQATTLGKVEARPHAILTKHRQKKAQKVAKLMHTSQAVTADVPNKVVTAEKTTILELAKQQEAVQQPTINEAKDPAISKLPDFIEETKKQQLQTNATLVSLQNQTKDLQSKVDQLNQELRATTYHFIQFSNQISSRQSKNYNQTLIESMRKHGIQLLSGIITLLVLCYFLKKTLTRQKLQAVPLVENNPHDEYDFMKGKEGIPTKLDLARVYIDMGDNPSAEAVLKDVMAQGNNEQRQSAQDLLSNMNNAT